MFGSIKIQLRFPIYQLIILLVLLGGLTIENTAGSTRVALLVLTALSIVDCIVLFWLVTMRLPARMRQIREQVRALAGGDLTCAPLVISGQDEWSELSRDLNALQVALREMLVPVLAEMEQLNLIATQLKTNVSLTNQTTGQIAEAMQEVAAGAENQLSNLTESVPRVRGVAESMEKVAANVQEITASTDAASAKANNGNRTVQGAVRQMDLVHKKVMSSATALQGLNKRSHQIESINDTITSIAKQTNLLSLNARIEAARAGEQGRGFAIVADRVHALAAESATAAKQIAALIRDIQAETNQAVDAMSEGTAAVQDGLQMVHDAGGAFQDILHAFDRVGERAEEVYATTENVQKATQMMVGKIALIASIAEEQAGNMQNVAAITQETNATIQEITAAANLMLQRGEELHNSLGAIQL